MTRYVFSIILFFGIAFACSSEPTNPPANLSLKGIAEWAELHGHISSGSGALPAVASAGSRYTDLSTPTAPIEYRSNGASWVAISSSGGAPGTSNHSELSELDYSEAGHTGFISTSTFDAANATLSAHLIDQIDPHGATMTISQGITVGSGSQDAQVYRASTGTVGIATDAYIVRRVGIGTSTPAVALHILDNGGEALYLSSGSARILGTPHYKPIFAHLCNDDNATVTVIAAQNTYYSLGDTVGIATSTAASQVSYGDITVNLATCSFTIGATGSGAYRLFFNASFSGGNSDEYEFHPFVNGEKKSCIGFSRMMGSAGDVGAGAANGILYLNPGDRVDMRVEQTTAGVTNITIRMFNFSLQRIGLVE